MDMSALQERLARMRVNIGKQEVKEQSSNDNGAESNKDGGVSIVTPSDAGRIGITPDVDDSTDTPEPINDRSILQSISDVSGAKNGNESIEEEVKQVTDVYEAARTVRENVSEAEQEVIEKTREGFGYAITFDKSAADAEDLRRLLFNNSMGKDFSLAEWELHKAAYNHQIMQVSQLSIIQIGYRIEALELLIKSNNAMLQACKEVEKEKKKRETAAERESRHALQEERYKKDKKEGRLRKKGEVDSEGALTGKLKKSEREKFIEKMMKMGIAKGKAEGLWDLEQE